MAPCTRCAGILPYMSVAVLPERTEVDTYRLLDLLVAANATDPELWPEGAKHGAELLRRIREIEAACIEAHGEFDWEQLDADTQDEYDGSRATLNKLRDPGPGMSLEEFERELDALNSAKPNGSHPSK